MSVNEFFSRRFKSIGPAQSLSEELKESWRTLHVVIASREARYISIFRGIKVISPFFEISFALFLIQAAIFAFALISAYRKP